MKNIIFSTTRQWNPGDEIILAGMQNVFREIGEQYNPIIYNRHPDIRSGFLQDWQILKAGFFDNSIKPHTDCSFADWVVFAGTPEWCSGRTYDLYRHILQHNIPVMILGVGGGLDLYDPRFLKVIQKAKALVVREHATLEEVRQTAPTAMELACPALLSARPERERRIGQVTRIALIYQASVTASVIWNGCSQAAHDWQMALYRTLIDQYGDRFQFSIVCHYVDELPLATRAFPGQEILYSYNAEDYLDIYARFDLVIGTRVHGIGAAASLGVPGVALAHCERSLTCQGFLADVIPCEHTPLSDAITQIEHSIAAAAVKNVHILRHKATTMEAYKSLIKQALLDPHVDYGETHCVGRSLPNLPSAVRRLTTSTQIVPPPTDCHRHRPRLRKHRANLARHFIRRGRFISGLYWYLLFLLAPKNT